METLRRFAQAYQTKNLDQILETLSPEALVISADGKVYEGLAAIRKRLLKEFQQTSAERIVPRSFDLRSTPEGARWHSDYEIVERRRNTGVRTSYGSFDASLKRSGNDWHIARAAFHVAPRS